jgi:hypothetical protein
LFQHIFDFPGPETGIDGNQHHARHRRAEFKHHPLGEILRPHRDPLTRPEMGQQCARGALRLGMELRIGPLPALRRIGGARDQRDPVRRRVRCLFEQAAERDVAHR